MSTNHSPAAPTRTAWWLAAAGGILLGVLAGWYLSHRATAAASVGPAPWVVGNPMPRGGVVNLAGQHVALARGKQGTVVILMATWCLYCAYLDRYDVPVLAATPGLAIDIVDTDVGGGIAASGPLSPPFGGVDHFGLPETTAQERHTLATYARRFGILHDAHFYVALPAAQHAWAPSKFPTLVAVDPSGQVVDVHPGTGDITWATLWLANQLGIGPHRT